jgi:hypothetical protein
MRRYRARALVLALYVSCAALVVTRVVRGDGGPCEADWAAAVYAQARSAVVRVVASNSEAGTGFFFVDECHVATALHVVSTGRPLRIELPDGTVLAGDVVAVDRTHDLAVLVTAPCAKGVVALRAGPTPSIGSPVMAIGNPFAAATVDPGPLHGLLVWSATTGVVSQSNDFFVQTDAATNPGNSGGPLLDCHGDVVGVVDRLFAPGVGFSVASSWLTPLAQSAIAAPRSYAGDVRFSSSLALQLDFRSSDSFQGFAISYALVIHDRWWVDLRLFYLPWGGPDSTAGPVQNPSLSSGGNRMGIDAAFGPRFLLLPYSPLVMYLQVAAGGGWATDQETSLRLSVATANGSNPSIVATPSTVRATRLEPLGKIGLFAGSKGTFELSYAYRFDVERLASSTSQISLGLWF